MHWLDPDYLPEISGAFERFLLNSHGDADGMILGEGLEVHFPPHMSADVRAVIRQGETIKVRGVRPRGSDMVAAVAIETMDGKRIVDDGPPKGRDEDATPDMPAPAKSKHEAMQAEGVVRRVLHGPKGEARGALLDDGMIIRIPAKEALHFAHLLSPGQRLAARGQGLRSDLGAVIDAREIGPSTGELHPLKPKEPEPKKHAPKDAADTDAATPV